MLTRDAAAKLAQNVLGLSSFPECSVAITFTEQAYTRFANNGVTTAAFAARNVVQITVGRDGQSGSAVTDDLDDAALLAAVKRAETLALMAPPNPEWLPDPSSQEFPALPPYDGRTASARSAEMLPLIKIAIDAAKQRKLVAAGLVERTHRASALANKTGLFAFHVSADAALGVTVRAADGSSSGWASQPSTYLGAIDSAKLAATAIEKCTRWKNPETLAPGGYTVVLEPAAAGDLVRLIGQGLSARTAEEGRSFVSKPDGGTRSGEKLFPEMVTLRTDPLDPRFPSLPWTPESLPARPISWIDRGVIANLFYDRYWAKKSGQRPTPFPANLILDGGRAPLQDLVSRVERGLLVTHFWYIRSVNPQTLQYTGLTRDGLFLIENGRISAAVRNLRFNESPVRLLKNTVALGPAIRVRGIEGGAMIAPPILATNFTFTSVSDAV
jgi:predicted Zn-dependent protease